MLHDSNQEINDVFDVLGKSFTDIIHGSSYNTCPEWRVQNVCRGLFIFSGWFGFVSEKGFYQPHKYETLLHRENEGLIEVYRTGLHPSTVVLWHFLYKLRSEPGRV